MNLSNKHSQTLELPSPIDILTQHPGMWIYDLVKFGKESIWLIQYQIFVNMEYGNIIQK